MVGNVPADEMVHVEPEATIHLPVPLKVPLLNVPPPESVTLPLPAIVPPSCFTKADCSTSISRVRVPLVTVRAPAPLSDDPGWNDTLGPNALSVIGPAPFTFDPL